MVRFEKFGVAAAALISGVIIGVSAGAAPACYTPSEWRAAHVRVMQQELQVAALECRNVAGHSFTDQYAAFIARFQDRLKANADALRAHFHRVYGGSSDRELDIFVTRVTNEASEHSMSDMSFCADSHPLFDNALAIEKANFEQAAIDHVTDHAAIGEECPVKAVPNKVASALPAVAKSKPTDSKVAPASVAKSPS